MSWSFPSRLRRLALLVVGALLLTLLPAVPPTAAAEIAYGDLADVARSDEEVTVTRGSQTITTRAIKTVKAPDGAEAVADRLIIGLPPGLSDAARQALHQQAGARASTTIRSLARISDDVEVVNFANPTALQGAIQAYQADPRVRYAEPDYIARTMETPNDTLFGSQWGMATMQMPAAWDVTHGSTSVRIAILDCGVYEDEVSIPNGFAGHPDINGRVALHRDFTGSSTGPDDFCDHGTHVAGTASAKTNNALGVAGVGYDTTLINGKVLGDTGSGASSWIQAGIRWAADNNARVINMSLGSDTPTCASSYQDAINYAWARNVVIVAAAGNSNLNFPGQPSNCANVVSVASTTVSDARSGFSNYGIRVHVAAPGSDILSTNYIGGYVNKSGTSMASPHVAGLAGLLWGRGGFTSNWQVVNQIKLSVNRIAGTGTFWQAGRVNGSRAVSQTPRGHYLWYFAEGYTGPGFDEYLTIANPGGSGVATITYFLERSSTPVVRTFALPAASRVTVAVHNAASGSNPGGLGRPSDSVGYQGHSTRVQTTVPVVVERPIYFTYLGGIAGGHNVMGINDLTTSWYFAEGYTGPGFDEYLTIQNPNASPGTAQITYFVERSATPVVRTVNLAANSRTTVPVHLDYDATSNPGGLGRPADGAGYQGHSTQVVTSVPTAIERPMYFRYAGSITGGHNVAGANAARTTWAFAEGYTGPGFDEYLTIQNPNGIAGNAQITYMPETGLPVVRNVPLPANSRVTVPVHAAYDATTNPGGLGRLTVGHSTLINTTVGTIIERPMYFNSGAFRGGHNVIGTYFDAYAWYFAEGYTGPGFSEFLTIANFASSNTTAVITYFVEGSATPTVRYVSVPANKRVTVRVSDPFNSVSNPGGLGPLSAGHSTAVESLGVPIVVERPMYFIYGGGRDGHNVMGYPLN